MADDGIKEPEDLLLDKAQIPWRAFNQVRILAYYPSRDLGVYQAGLLEDMFFIVNRQGFVRFFRGFGALQQWLKKNRYEAISEIPTISPWVADFIEGH
jgi:hypothetical protein